MAQYEEAARNAADATEGGTPLRHADIEGMPRSASVSVLAASRSKSTESGASSDAEYSSCDAYDEDWEDAHPDPDN